MGGQGGTGRTIRTVVPKAPPAGAFPSDALTRAQMREPYSRMCLTRTLEKRLVVGYRPTTVVGDLSRSLGKPADAAGSTVADERRDVMSPLVRDQGAMLVMWARPVGILRQDSAPVATGVHFSFTLRDADRVGPAYDAAGAISSGAARWVARH